MTARDLARQVRQGFYGVEVQSIQRGRDEVKVMVRYPAEERRSLADVEAHCPTLTAQDSSATCP